MDLLLIVEAVRSYLRTGWDWLRRYWWILAIVLVLNLLARLLAYAIHSTPWDVLLGSATVVVLGVSTALWLLRDRQQRATIRNLAYERDRARHDAATWHEYASNAEKDLERYVTETQADRAEIAARIAKRAGGQR